MNTQQDPAQPGPSAPPPPPGPGPAAAPGAGEFPGGAAAPRLFGLVRPQHGRYVAGVCAGIGRATNTDPVLWRVLLAVLAVFGGTGLLVYLAAWLIIPAEGDTGSPLEGVLGKGDSGTSPITVVGLAILAMVTFAYIMSDTWRAMLLVACAAIVGVLIVNRGRLSPPGHPAAPPPPPPYPGAPAASDPFASSAEPAPGVQPVPPNDSYPPQPGYAPAPPPWQAPPTGGYRPPFAPHGPYSSPYTATNPPPPAPPRQRPPKPPKERSPLFGATVSLILMAIGVLAIIDLSNLANPAAGAYFAVALGIIGAGMLLGTRWGRGRGLIVPGLIAAVALGISVAAETDGYDETDANTVWAPKTMNELSVRQSAAFGDATLDLRALDFTGQDKSTQIELGVGDVTVLLPPNVDVIVDVDLGAGNADVLGRTMDGVGSSRRFEDLGADGVGGGKLALTISNGAGDVEVTR
ncbi:phage shock protein PspC (stress-responsive transcriptional regulator) [Catenuloplanes nepalensis]|uniref:Phage shock protein PspC (Stress-responsive transcriptional regulator) n=1 Tax=Catenuloplanes nepalensis TaxID=587533 RepID=A0ABT9N6B7_9ACTN|nr:PspC domain-containing protein [Catenuloplanes nepalensis]MDP9799244.1 phage shock protein PspC (stress-responsive transcriptional regulator) [Catenuloplanes nepalensis]